MEKKIIRVFPRRTNATPDDESVRSPRLRAYGKKRTKYIFRSLLHGIYAGQNGRRNNGDR